MTHSPLLEAHRARIGRFPLLTSQEFALLEFLCRNVGKVVTRSMILERVWGLNIELNLLRGTIYGDAAFELAADPSVQAPLCI